MRRPALRPVTCGLRQFIGMVYELCKKACLNLKAGSARSVQLQFLTDGGPKSRNVSQQICNTVFKELK
jgi:hypothetical protein